jgi:large subunit ribosomal protein L20
MARVKRGVVARKRHKKILKLAKGYYGARSRVFRVAKQAVIKAGQYAYRDRRQKKRQFRACGSLVSTLVLVLTVCPTAVSSPV